jgi:hypothetical protein
MALYISRAQDVVDPLDLDFDRDDITESLQTLKDELKDDIEVVEFLIEELHEWVAEAEERVSEIKDVLDEREAADDVVESAQATEGDESKSVQAAPVG